MRHGKSVKVAGRFIALIGEKPKAVAYHMHDAQLDTSFQIHRVDDLPETSQIVDTDDERQRIEPGLHSLVFCLHIPSISFWISTLMPRVLHGRCSNFSK